MNCLLCPGKETKQDPKLIYLIVWGPKVGQSVYLIPWSGEATGFALEMWEVMAALSVQVLKHLRLLNELHNSH